MLVNLIQFHKGKGEKTEKSFIKLVRKYKDVKGKLNRVKVKAYANPYAKRVIQKEPKISTLLKDKLDKHEQVRRNGYNWGCKDWANGVIQQRSHITLDGRRKLVSGTAWTWQMSINRSRGTDTLFPHWETYKKLHLTLTLKYTIAFLTDIFTQGGGGWVNTSWFSKRLRFKANHLSCN